MDLEMDIVQLQLPILWMRSGKPQLKSFNERLSQLGLELSNMHLFAFFLLCQALDCLMN